MLNGAGELLGPDEGVQEGFLEEVASGSLILFGGALEVWPGHRGLCRNLVKFSVSGKECVCMHGG